MSSVFLTNVDDYLAPSQACVNPLFAERVNAKKDDDTAAEAVAAVVVSRKRTIRRRRGPIGSDDSVPALPVSVTPIETAKVSMADCLACSGCVTSAETVLVEQHSIKTLREKLALTTTNSVVFTISPASWADILRHLQLGDAALSRRKLASFLHQSCRASVVLDGQIPLQWSLLEAAHEFCYVYQSHRSSSASTTLGVVGAPPASIAISATQSQWLHDTTLAVTTHTTRSESYLPLVSSSCPAVVCLVEKSYPTIVPHLATTMSPMTMAGTYFAKEESQQSLHICIMPCHDKKLEASRGDFLLVGAHGSGSNKGEEEQSTLQPCVDLVITTREWIDLIQQTCGSTDVEGMRFYIESLDPAVSVSSLHYSRGGGGGDPHKVVLVESSLPTNTGGSNMVAIEGDDAFFIHSSGGYADFIFRYAAQHLFGYSVQGRLPWKPVEARGKMSARVASSRKKDYHTVTLYQWTDGQQQHVYSTDPQAHGDEEDATVVLRFATAYGFQTVQRILQPLEKDELEFDYVEAMACPSGCLNGGGQVRVADRETPKETRARVVETQQRLVASGMMSSSSSSDHPTNLDVYTKNCPSGPFGAEAQLSLHTRYHVVPPLQHSLGAAAGVKVQDTQW